MTDWMEIISNTKIAQNVYEMKLKGQGAGKITAPGQFVNIKVSTLESQPYLRRPMSVCEYDDENLTIIYKVVGKGTNILKSKQPGEKLDMLLGLGNGFPLPDIQKAVLIGGGVGVPPMYELGKQLVQKGVEVTTILGFNSSIDVFYEDKFKALGDCYVATMDGSYGEKGNVVDVLKKYQLTYDKYFSCGPEKMLDALVKFDDQNGYLSFEARMGCGFGACMGCSCKVKTKPYKRICVEGPVLEASEVIINE
jgi:2-polyprenylphenol hydroxylase and related flavodoxin oxidoreductases